MKSTLRCSIIAFAGLLASAAVLSANLYTFTLPLSGLQEVPQVVTPGSGTATVTLDSETNELTWDVSYENMLGTLTMAHFHGPADFGENAGVLVNMNPDLGSNTGTIVGSATVTNEVRDNVLAGMTYINLHSSEFGAGELRGQVIPEPSTYALLLGLGALAGVFVWRRRRSV
ncbi:MAG: CHRD domain-containing protein [Opitutales bacterium]|nr:CHRD domain-containing protein [Opitutales bacterium]